MNHRIICFLMTVVLALNIQAQERIITIHLNNGIAHQYKFAEVDSVSFAELAEVLPNIEEGAQMMTTEMQDPSLCSQYYPYIDHYLIARNKNIVEYVANTWGGLYGLMPLEKEKMVMLYGGGKYIATKYGSNHTEALYDENLNPVCAFTLDRNNATYTKNVMSYTIDLTDKEGIYYLRRFSKLSYADKSSVIAVEEFTPKGRTSDVKLLNTNISRFKKGEKGIVIPITKTASRISFDFTIDENANIDGEPIKLAEISAVGNEYTVSVLRRAPEPMKVRYYGDAATVEKANAQELSFKSGFIIGKDTIVRSLDLYKPLTGESCLMLWLKGTEYDEEPTAEILQAHEESLKKYANYCISLQNNELSLFDGENLIASVALTDGVTVKQLCETISANPAFADFMVYPLVDTNTTINTLMQFPKINLVGNYYQSFDVTKFSQISSFGYHYDSFPIVLRSAIDTSTHTFDAVCTNDGIYVGIDGNFRLLDYDVVRNIYINDKINISNLDVLDGKHDYLLKKLSGTTRLSVPYIVTPRSPYLLGMMGHHVAADAKEGNVSYANSDVSSERLAKICKIMKDEGYETLNMDELVKYMDKGMKTGKYAFFMFDDFQIDDLYLAESTRNIFIDNGIKTNLALIQGYLWDGFTNKAKGKYIQPMKELGWSCVSHSLRHNQPTAKKPSIYLNYELKQARKECEQWGMNSEVYVYNWDGSWEVSDVLFKKNGYKYAINSRSTFTTKSTNPYRLGRTSFQEALPFSTIEKTLKW